MTRGEHPIHGLGFSYETIQPLEDVQLPLTLSNRRGSRKVPLSELGGLIAEIKSHGIKQSDIAKLADVSRQAIANILKNKGLA
jgi:hypothetical protein